MTVRELLHALHTRIPAADLDLEVFTIHGASGESCEVGNPSLKVKAAYHDIGPLCRLPDGTRFVQLYIGN